VRVLAVLDEVDVEVKFVIGSSGLRLAGSDVALLESLIAMSFLLAMTDYWH